VLQVKNATPFAAALMLLPDRHGVDTVFTVVKGTFSLTPGMAVADQQVPIAPLDKHRGDPARTSIASPSDVSLGKAGTDVLLAGSAVAPHARPTWHMHVSLAVGPVAKTVRVSGDRVWKQGAAGASVEWVAPFESMPLIWERAYGGSDETSKGPTAEPRNPIGTGFRARDSAKPITGLPLPNLEDPAAPVSSWSDAPPPAAFGPVAAHWEPRKSYAGTYDEAWQRSRAPYLPDDFDVRFCQVAPPGLTTPRHLSGGEVVDVRGVTPSGELRFVLPAIRIRATYRLDGTEQARDAALDTVLIDADAERLVLVWRAALTCDKKALRVREVAVSAAAGA
jgi:hypothetical protein